MKIDQAEELATKLGRVRDNLAAVLPKHETLVRELCKLKTDTINGLLDALYVLNKQDEDLFEAFLEWVHDDPGGPALMDLVPSRLGYREWLDRRTKETIGSMMFR